MSQLIHRQHFHGPYIVLKNEAPETAALRINGKQPGHEVLIMADTAFEIFI